MASDDEHQTATVYVDEDLDEEDDESDEEDRILQNQNNEEEDVDLIDDEVDEDDEEEEDDSTSSAAGDVTIAVAGTPNVATTVAAVTASPTTVTTTATASIVRSDAIVEAKKPTLDDSRRLFQRLWTDEDEIELLQGFLEYTIQRGTNNSSHHHHDTAAFYDQIKGKLQLEFNKNQLVEKLRRLKKKYRNVLTKISSGKEYVFKSPHDQATFDLSCKIWNEAAATPVSVAPVADGGGIDDEEGQNTNVSFNLNEHNGNGIGVGVGDPNSLEKKVPRPRKRSRVTPVKIEESYNHHHHHQQQQFGQAMGAGGSNLNPNHVTSNLVEETVKSCLLPLFKELVNNSPNGGVGNSRGFGLGLGLGGMNVNSFGGSMNFPTGDMTDEKWRKQQILELEVYSKRLDLMQDQIKSWLEELRSMGN
ncbi:hypothetical protein QVD17_17293 [Tagetes erecta]|uniref:Glabrous enhancer-binding protein-like DBD domain-containing protein n=1 Tax=Tagetes erecta TaxID=13708 RepID=A0AAD8KSY1_TARER|nr:hypothetical protein QVD17_17293 [Tagetes erecta]